MLGTRFLSAFLKVNPYFTVAIAVSFTGIAAVGVKHSDAVSLKKLIPLHIKSMFSDDPPDRIVPDKVPGIERARQLIHEMSLGFEGTKAAMAARSDHPNYLFTPPVPAPASASGRAQETALARLNEPRLSDIAAKPPWPDLDQPALASPYWIAPEPFKSTPWASEVIPLSAASFADLPSVRLSLDVPLDAPLVLAPVVLIDVLPVPPFVPPDPVFIPPDPVFIQAPVISTIQATEPAVGFLFAGLIVGLIGLHRWAFKSAAVAVVP